VRELGCPIVSKIGSRACVTVCDYVRNRISPARTLPYKIAQDSAVHTRVRWTVRLCRIRSGGLRHVCWLRQTFL